MPPPGGVCLASFTGGTNGGVEFQLGDKFSRTVGTGTYAAAVSYATANIFAQSTETADFNGDGLMDLVVINQDRARLEFLLQRKEGRMGAGPGKTTGWVNRLALQRRVDDLHIGLGAGQRPQVQVVGIGVLGAGVRLATSRV